MNRLATTVGAAALLIAAPLAASAQDGVVTNWTNNTAPFATSGDTERGFAYGVVGGNERIYVVDRTGGAFVNIFDATTGSFLNLAGGSGSGSLLTTGVTGGTFALNDVAVTSDGVIYACNLQSNISTGNFKCYRWANEGAAPTVALDRTAGAVTSRVGDRITVTGSGATTAIWAPGNANNRVYKFTTTDGGLTFPNVIEYTITGFTAGNQPSLTADPNDPTRIWITHNALGIQLAQLSAPSGTAPNQTGTGTLIGTGLPGGIFPTGSNSPIAFKNAAGDSTYLAAFIFTGLTGTSSYFTRIANVTTYAAGAESSVYQWGQTQALTGNANGNGAGEVAIRDDAGPALTLFTLATNNGMNSSTTNKASLPVELSSFTAAADGSEAVLRWTTESETNNAGFAIETLRGSAWAEVAFVGGRGTTSERASYERRIDGLAAGTHTFRLVQRDLDGTATVAGTVELSIGMNAAIVAEGRGASVRFGARDAGTVTAEAYDVTGRRVAVLFAGSVGAGEMREVELSGVASGVYFVRVSGRTGSETARVIVR